MVYSCLGIELESRLDGFIIDASKTRRGLRFLRTRVLNFQTDVSALETLPMRRSINAAGVCDLALVEVARGHAELGGLYGCTVETD